MGDWDPQEILQLRVSILDSGALVLCRLLSQMASRFENGVSSWDSVKLNTFVNVHVLF